MFLTLLNPTTSLKKVIYNNRKRYCYIAHNNGEKRNKARGECRGPCFFMPKLFLAFLLVLQLYWLVENASYYQ